MRGETSTVLSDPSVGVAREMARASAQARPRNDFRAVDSAKDG